MLIDWLLDPALRQRVAAALSKGEARNTLARAVCFNRLDKLHDPPYELQCHRASGLNLAVAARANGELAFPHPPPKCDALREVPQPLATELLPLAEIKLNCDENTTYSIVCRASPGRGRIRDRAPEQACMPIP
ncbi:Transposase (plasmid) [Mycetohabitans rhizoxinica HKI 454]|uniref:Transposase n=1 Tax=Mycetohabitans rhizoxinica (strain DSM 19002 / CIP 109453 / HKI 454) TaxID=882378 RepID=E5AV58_MYCRK|nr:Transposase [Mycetohabitans rhizoxinica HKI 454]